MKRSGFPGACIGLVAVLAGPGAGAVAQDPAVPAPRGERQDAAGPRLVRSRSLIGAGVRLAGTPREAAARRAAGREEDPATPTIGSIVDLVVDTSSGKVFLAVAGRGRSASQASRILVPLRTGSWDATHKQFVLRVSRAQLEVLPRIDASWFGGEINQPEQDHSQPALSKRVPARAARRRARELATRLSLRPVRAKDGKVGAGSGLVVELGTGTVAFLSVVPTAPAARGLTYFVPWEALRCVGPEHGRSPCIEIAIEREQLARAPRGVGDGMSDLCKPEMRRKIYAFYGVEPPAFEVPGDAGKN